MDLKRREFLKMAAAGSAVAALGLDVLSPRDGEAQEPDRWAKGVCRYCGVGCGVMIGVRGSKVVAIKGDQDNPVNKGLLCIKGITLAKILDARDRARSPMIRRGEEWVQATWNDALDLIASKFKEAIAKHGPESVAFYGSGQAYTEESYVANKLMKAGIGANNIDGNPRLCMASAVGGYVTTFGKDEPFGVYEDLDHADCYFVIGSNMAECHPVIFSRILSRKAKNPNAKMIVLDPRKTATGRSADLYISFTPGYDLAILNAMAHEIVKEGLADEAFIKENLAFHSKPDDSLTYEQYKTFLEDYAPEKAAQVAGCSADQIRQAARLFAAKGKETMSFWTMGLNQRTRGVAANNLVHNLHLITGKVGRPGSTSFSLTGQPNACGGVRDTGSLSHLLPAGRLVANAKDREEMEKLWGVPAGRISSKPGPSAVEMFRAFAEGKIKAMLIYTTNPGQSLPNLLKYRRGMESGESFLAVSEAYHPSRTSELADVVLPAALWVEKTGVYGNSERRYQLTEQQIKPIGEAKSELWILMELAKRLGHEGLVPFKSNEDVWNEWRTVARPTPYNFYGMTYDRLRKERGVLWPVPDESHPGTKRRYVRGEDPLVPAGSPRRIVFYGKPDKRAWIWLRPQEAPAEPADAEYPFILTTGRVLEHWHTGTMTLNVPELRRAAPESFVEIHPTDAGRLGIKAKDLVKISSRRGSIVVPARVVDVPRPGVVFVPFHYPDKLINLVTIDAFDPISKQPEFKICAVKVSKA